MRTIFSSTVAALALVLLAGAARAAEPAATSDTSHYATYREHTEHVTLVVGTFLASEREHEAYIPFPVAVALFGKAKSVVVTPESFVLVDSAGHRYPAASFEEIRQRYDKLHFDRAVLHARPLVLDSEFPSGRRVAANFFPSSSDGLRTERVWLSAFSWFTDVIYFPRPQFLGGTLRVEFRPEGLGETIAARVRVPGMAGVAPSARDNP